MRLLTPEVVYHNIQPIYSCDLQPKSDDFCRLATGGLDGAVRLWRLQPHNTGKNIELIANLCRHDKEVNAVRWSPSGKILASASSDGVIILWEKIDGKVERNNESDDTEAVLEVWNFKCLRRHIQDIYDICWSSDDTHIISGSIDCSAILWNIKNHKSLMLKDHKQFIQGVAWDPLENFVVTQSADRTFRVYQQNSRNCIYKVWKSGDVKLFQDGSWKFFFRRLQFSPDGKLLVTPAGLYNTQKENINMNNSLTSAVNTDEHCAHIFLRNNLSKVAVTIPTGKSPVIGVRFNPVRFTLKKTDETVFKLPYRWIFCLVLDTGILVFDTEQSLPIVKVSNIHCLSINDASWSSDGRCLVVCSTDGYCSYIYFEEGELGEPFTYASQPHQQSSIVPIASEIVKSSIVEGSNVPIDMAMDSTEILARNREDESISSSCSDDNEDNNCEIEQDDDNKDKYDGDDNDNADVDVKVVEVHLPIAKSAVKRRLTLSTVTENRDNAEMEPKDKKRRLTLTTLID